MKEIYIRPVSTKKEMRDFIKLPNSLYADCPYYVPDMESDVRDTFKKKGNVILEESDIQPFIAYNKDGKAVGRIAAIINHKANAKWNTKSVRFGFIEFIDNMDVSAALFKAVEQWGAERGMNKIQGPMGIFDFDKEGMLVEDFDQLGTIATIYNPAYYPKHMEALGFEKEVDWVQIRVGVPKETPARFTRVAKLSKERLGLTQKKLTDKDITKGGYGKRIFDLLNTAYSPLFGYTELSDRQIDLFVKRYISLVDKRMLSVIENKEGELVGVAVTLGSLSHAMRKSKGRLLPFGWYHLLKALKWKHEDKVEMLLIAVHPKYHGLGVNALFFVDLIPIYQQLGYTWAETGPQLESNMKELSQWKDLNPQVVKRRRCYTKNI